ncbi:MAG: ABC transporter substrate-binding protein [Granulosicoccus sp.]
MKENIIASRIAPQASQLTQGRVTRRQFILSALAAGATLPLAMSIADNALAATPKKGGRLRQGLGYGSTTDTLDPGTSENGFSQALLYSYGNHLTEVGSDGTLIPELCESYEPTAGATVWRFKLRSGVEFHNGKTLTADDIIATYNYHRGDDSKSAAKGLLTAVKSITKDGDDVVVFELESGNADFPYIVSDYHLVVQPEKDGQIDALSGIGTGGYVLDSFEPGVRALLNRNPNYFKEDKAHFDDIEMLSILDVTARQNAIMNGDVDVIDNVDPKTVALLARVPTLNILETTGTQHYTFPMRLDVEPFGNRDLRLALKYAINRQELVDKILLGHGVVGNDIPVSSAMPFLNTDIPQREFNPDKAAEYYKASGHSGTIQLSASDAAFAGAVDAAQLIAASAKAAGIDIEVVREPKDGYWSNVWNKKGWCACYWGGRPTQDWMYSAAYTSDTEWNDTAWKDTEDAKTFNELVVAARSETDLAVRKEQYFQAQQLLHDDGGAIVGMWANYIHAHSKKIMHGDNVAANWVNDGNKIAERWWFA